MGLPASPILESGGSVNVFRPASSEGLRRLLLIDNFGEGTGSGDVGLAEFGVSGNRFTLNCWSSIFPFPWSTTTTLGSVESSNEVRISGGPRY